MRHVFVETNWLVDYAAPEHRREPSALALLERCRLGEFRLHLPALCLNEARRAIRTKFQPRPEADAIRRFVRWAREVGALPAATFETVVSATELFERRALTQIETLDETLAGLRAVIDIFPMDERQLELSIELSFSKDIELKPHDQAVLAAVIGRSEAIRRAADDDQLFFCERDSDLLPWRKSGERHPQREALRKLYDSQGIWVFADFAMTYPPTPDDWHPAR